MIRARPWPAVCWLGVWCTCAAFAWPPWVTQFNFIGPWLKSRQGNRLYEQGKYEQARKLYESALTDSPDSPELQLNIGHTQYQLRKFEDAVESYRKAIQNSDDVDLQAQAWYDIGNCQFKLNKFADAIQSYKQALELDPDNRDAKFNLELARRKLMEHAKQSPGSQDHQQQQQQQSDKRDEKQQSGKSSKSGKSGKAESGKASAGKTGKAGKAGKGKQNGKAKAAGVMSKEEAERLLDELRDDARRDGKRRMTLPVPESSYSGPDY